MLVKCHFEVNKVCHRTLHLSEVFVVARVNLTDEHLGRRRLHTWLSLLLLLLVRILSVVRRLHELVLHLARLLLLGLHLLATPWLTLSNLLALWHLCLIHWRSLLDQRH